MNDVAGVVLRRIDVSQDPRVIKLKFPYPGRIFAHDHFCALVERCGENLAVHLARE